MKRNVQSIAGRVGRSRWPRRSPFGFQRNYREIVELAPIGIFLSTIEGRFLGANAAFARMLGYDSVEDLLRLDIPRDVYFDPRGRDRIIARSEQVQGIVSTEALLKRKDGSPLLVRFDGRVVRNRRGRVIGFEGFVHDVSEGKRAAEALARSEERFRALVENSSDGVVVMDENAIPIYVSPSTVKIFGYTPEEIAGQYGRFSLVHPDEREAERAKFRRALDGSRQPVTTVYHARHKDGSWRTIEAVAVDRRSDPSVGGLVLNLRDVTETRRAEQALRESEDRFRAVIENSHEVIGLLDAGERWIYASPSVLRILGYTPQEILDTRIFGERVHPEDLASVRARVDPLMRDARGTATLQFRSRHKDGSWRFLDAAAVNRLDEPSVRAVVVNLRDVTAQREADGRLRRSYDEIRALAARVETVREEEASRIAHELHDEIGQALTAVKLQLQTLQRRAGAPAVSAEMDEAIASTERALEQVRDLSLSLRPSVLDDLGLTAALRWYLDRQAQLSGFAAELRADPLPTRLPRELETACFRVVQQALTNVARHAQAQHVSVELRRGETELRLSILDDGMGFDAAAAQARARAGQSLGILGMKERVSLLGGQFTLRSDPSSGTEIQVRFPIVPTNGIPGKA